MTREYQEAALERGMRKWLGQAKIGERFARVEVGNQEYRAAFPFVEKQDELVLKAIRPLHLNQPAPNKILDHGGQWLFRVQALKKRGLLPERVLFAVNGPTHNDPRVGAVREIVDSLQDIGVTVLPYAEAADSGVCGSALVLPSVTVPSRSRFRKSSPSVPLQSFSSRKAHQY